MGEKKPGWYSVLVRRCSKLEACYASMEAQIKELAKELKEKQETRNNDDFGRDWYSRPFSGNFSKPYSSLLHSLGHALFVTTISSAHIFFWLVFSIHYYFFFT